MKRTLRHASGWALLAVWFVVGAGCSGSRDAKTDARFVVDIIKTLCTPEQTIDACVDRLLELQGGTARALAADSGAD